RHGLDDIGVKRALREKLRLARALSRRLEHLDERLADDLAFAIGVCDALQPSQEELGRVLILQPDLEMAAEDFPRHRRLSSAQQAVIDENAGELTANGLVQQCRSYARIHAAAQTQDHLLNANLGADGLDRLVSIVAHRPVSAAAADAVDEAGEDLPPLRRVH